MIDKRAQATDAQLVRALGVPGLAANIINTTIGASIFLLGMLLYRYGKSWSQRFVRRPPPDVVLPPP